MPHIVILIIQPISLLVCALCFDDDGKPKRSGGCKDKLCRVIQAIERYRGSPSLQLLCPLLTLVLLLPILTPSFLLKFKAMPSRFKSGQWKASLLFWQEPLGRSACYRILIFVHSWSYEFYCKWKKWVLPKDCILIEKENDGGDGYGKILRSFESDHVVGCVLRANENAGLVRLGIFVEDDGDSKFFDSSYESRIVSVLCGMSEEERNELEIILNATFRVCNVGKGNGFWYNVDGHCVYMVFKKFGSFDLMKCVIKEKEDEEGMFSTDEMSGYGMLGMEICEILSGFHFEGLVIGCLGVSCFGFNEFGRVCFDLSEVLNMGRRVVMAMRSGRKDLEVSVMKNLLDNNVVFISPEVLSQFMIKQGFELDLGKSRYDVGCASDVWSSACLLVWLILGSSFVEEMKAFMHCVINATNEEKGCDYSEMYMNWTEKIAALLRGRLGLKCVSLQEILCRSLELDPRNRPLITELWKCLRELVTKAQFDIELSVKEKVKKENLVHCVVLGELCRIIEQTDKELIYDRGDGKLRVDGDVIEGVSQGRVKCIEMKGHLDCVSGLAIGDVSIMPLKECMLVLQIMIIDVFVSLEVCSRKNKSSDRDYLFSSSYDKIVRVWSLQDFTHVHSFKGHDHRVMAVVFVNGEQPLCISGDNEGVICIWIANFPFPEVPLKKLYEKKDWRYSGIHAMAISGTEYLYTGSGDKLVKAWSLQDYSLSCEMSGHRSVVSCLIVCNGVLYSGSWDGTVRLWSLSDHSPLTVLGEDKDKLGNVASVLSLSAEHNSLFVGHENGTIKIWHNDVLLKSIQTHKGAVFSVRKNGKWLFSGGWDKTINVQEIPENVDGVDVAPVGTIACNSTITALVYWEGKLFVGQADRIIKVYHGT
ncbi:hypothetical protein BUALT_Bualt08G0116000 [Buddleja alternifolia]|uniref:Protein kinase domain-containing protein n=1 Tax=Buddleja alternifolia TaxID=168488 RepID=A0AAV6XDP6_9LAMI|nr:hypothetical protein BUALT_Bualt08G0116000 [Buddleja alternifolia]